MMISEPAGISLEPLTAEAFAPFGDVIGPRTAPDMMINQGRCERHHDLARLDFLRGSAGVSLFRSAPVSLPYDLEMMERHPLGSQAFLPLSGRPYFTAVAPDAGGAPGTPRAFLAAPGQGINLLRNVWHGVLTPLDAPADFAVVDRIAPIGEEKGANLQEYWFSAPVRIEAR